MNGLKVSQVAVKIPERKARMAGGHFMAALLYVHRAHFLLVSVFLQYICNFIFTSSKCHGMSASVGQNVGVSFCMESLLSMFCM